MGCALGGILLQYLITVNWRRCICGINLLSLGKRVVESGFFFFFFFFFLFFGFRWFAAWGIEMPVAIYLFIQDVVAGVKHPCITGEYTLHCMQERPHIFFLSFFL